MGRILDAGVEFFTDDEWPHEQMGDKPVLRTGFQGKNGALNCFFQELEAQEQVCFYSVNPLMVPEDKRALVAEFILRANYGMIVGNFEMDYNDGKIRYKTSADVEGTDIPQVFIRNLIHANVMTMDRYVPGIAKVVYADADPAEAVAEVES